MDFVFTELMLWGRDHGYSWFSIGMAPLAGRCRGTLAPPWHGIGHLIYRHGENFYNFEGLRRVKEKLDPVWEYRYAAWPDGIPGLPRALLDSARLASGSTRRVRQQHCRRPRK